MAGLSGPAIKPLALAAVARLVAALTIPVIGIGGIASAEDAREFLGLGARAVQIGTANFYRPGVAAACAAEL
jgi:dihydroorotate dehydrogenase (NAD+) catalytic subunit